VGFGDVTNINIGRYRRVDARRTDKAVDIYASRESFIVRGRRSELGSESWSDGTIEKGWIYYETVMSITILVWERHYLQVIISISG
jgi:hypothetical protein